MPSKRSHNCSSCSDRRCHGTGAHYRFWPLPAGDAAGALVARWPCRETLLAEALGQAGQPEAGLTVLAEAVTLVAATEEWWWEAEV